MIAQAGGEVAHDVVIIGGGFSGAAVALHLAASASKLLRIAIIGAEEALGGGIAYGVMQEHFRLNVPAGRLSILPQGPGDFHDWCLVTGKPATPGSFLPRAWFGEYTRARLAEAVAAKRGSVRLTHIRDNAVGLEQDASGVRIVTSSGRQLIARHAVLALGLGPTRFPPALEAWRDDPRVLSSPWDAPRMDEVARGTGRVLLVGNGLTMCDAAVSLARGGYRGNIIALSRRGLLARSHGPKDEAPHAPWAASLRGDSALGLLRQVRLRCEGGDWRGVIDSMRPHTARLWHELGHGERSRFMHRLAAYWDVHRHRAPPEVAAALGVLMDRGQLCLWAGGLQSVRDRRGMLTADVACRGVRGTTPLELDAIVLCTGPEPDPTRWGSNLISSLVTAGRVSVDPLGLGLRSTDDGFTVAGDGSTNHALSMLGPLRRGDLWESTAVPEISVQAERLARAVNARLVGHRHTASPPHPYSELTP